MRTHTFAVSVILAACGGRGAAAQQSPATPQSPSAPPTASTPDERLVFTADGSALSGGSGGGGAAATWLRNFDGPATIGAGADYEQLANAHWTTGMLSGSLALGPAGSPTTLYGEAHEGPGDIGMQGFHYSLLIAGVVSPLNDRLSVQLEERRIDIDTSHGNLPKVGLSFKATPHLLASVSYQDSAGGNLGTRLGTVRIDYSGTGFTAVAGADGGYAAPAVLNLLGQVLRPAPTLTEGFAGIGKPFGRTDWLLLGDYQDLAGFKRTTVTLVCTVHLEARGGAR
jgi:hypothetical protein